MSEEEKDPHFGLEYGGDKYEVGRQSASIFSYLGELAVYNHIFIVTEVKESESYEGIYIFNQLSVYAKVFKFMVDNRYPPHYDIGEVGQCDLDAFDKMIKQEASDIGNTIPDGWV